ncbi:tetratricopeptide repeat protein [Rothia sp. ZJ932]|uniref:tetratricopeptide repeat protein n=1 Tax=Rothia sp. ZJ932 TaxID=2810516 RepID=UPI001967013E|nr:tetratricopeptide repeat protein [Rothia sp. ZJ932]QRZ62286.1 tetratricopeptide repeat protein [Rothia sp. ZJ932]
MTQPTQPLPQQPQTPIPASVRGAYDLSQAQAAAPSPEPAAEPSWRFDVETPEDFQKYVQLSQQGAVIFALWAEHSPASKETLEILERTINTAGGNLLLAAVDIVKLPEIGQAFQIQGVPAAIAVIAGQPAPMFNSQVGEEQILQLLQQVLQLSAQHQLPGGFEPHGGEAEKPLPPLHQKAVDAIDAGDFAGARDAYTQALNENPGDRDAKIGLAQVGLLERVGDLSLADARAAAAANPTDVQAAFNVADLDVTGGHVEDAFNRLITLFKAVDAEQKNTVRERLLELFDVVGSDDPRVKKARADLMMAIF